MTLHETLQYFCVMRTLLRVFNSPNTQTVFYYFYTCFVIQLNTKRESCLAILLKLLIWRLLNQQPEESLCYTATQKCEISFQNYLTQTNRYTKRYECQQSLHMCVCVVCVCCVCVCVCVCVCIYIYTYIYICLLLYDYLYFYGKFPLILSQTVSQF